MFGWKKISREGGDLLNENFLKLDARIVLDADEVDAF